MATQYAFGKIVTNGLILSLDAADKNSYVSGSTVWNDLSGNIISGSLVTGSLQNSPTFNSANQGSFLFDGTSQYVTFPYTIQNSLTNQISLSSWVNPQWYDTGNNDGTVIINKAMPSLIAPYTIWDYGLDTTGKYYGNISDGVTRSQLISALTVPLNIWVNLVFTYDGATMKLYKNAVQDVNTTSRTLTFGQNTVPIYLASYRTLTSTYFDWFKGNLANIQIYNRALTATEVFQNYEAQKSRFDL
jgi:hypothetical protein